MRSAIASPTACDSRYVSSRSCAAAAHGAAWPRTASRKASLNKTVPWPLASKQTATSCCAPSLIKCFTPVGTQIVVTPSARSRATAAPLVYDVWTTATSNGRGRLAAATSART
jgi:hypothetical protein